MIAEDRKKKIQEEIERVKIKDHIVHIYDNEDDHKDILVSYIKSGIERNEKIISIEYSLSEEALLNALNKEGLDVNYLINKGQLKILSHNATYIKDGYFDIDRMIKFWQNEMDIAMSEGYPALRVTGEASWIADAPLGSEFFMKYESTINKALNDSKCIVLCRYDIKSLDLQALSDSLSNHPKVFIGTRELNNDDYYLTTDHFLSGESEKLKVNNWLKNIENSYDNKKRLVESEKIYSLLYSAMSEGVCIHEILYDEDGKAVEYEILDVNPAYESILGLKKEDVIGKRASDIYKTDKPPYIEIYSKVASTGNPITFETYFEPMNKYFHISAVYLGEKDKFATIFSDITDFVKLQKELKNAKEAAEAANKIKSEFIANMSHEFRTPLNAIIGFTDMILTGVYGKLSDKVVKYLNNVSTSGKHLLNLVNDILDISKIEAGKMELSYGNFSSKQVIYEIILTFESMVTLKNINLEIRLSDTNINADMGKFRQIIYNLVSNAVKYTPENGKIFIYSDINNNELVITVEDTGIGIAKENYSKVFSKFKQIDSSYSRNQEGTGLGLALSSYTVALFILSLKKVRDQDFGSLSQKKSH